MAIKRTVTPAERDRLAILADAIAHGMAAEEERQTIILRLHRRGVSFADIADAAEMHRPNVYRIVRKVYG